MQLQLQFALRWESQGHKSIAADELSTANFSVRGRQCEEKNFICSQNMSYRFESSVNTAGTLGWWQLANKLEVEVAERGERQMPKVLSMTQWKYFKINIMILLWRRLHDIASCDKKTVRGAAACLIDKFCSLPSVLIAQCDERKWQSH